MEMAVSMRPVELRELTYVVTMVPHQLVSIVVISQLLLSMMIYTDLSVRDTVYVGLYTASGGKYFCYVRTSITGGSEH